MNERGVLRGFDECRGGTQAVRLEDFRHLGDRQSLGERERDDERVAARDLVDHLQRRHRVIEAIFTGLQPPSLAAQPQRQPVGLQIADDTARDQALADGKAARAGRDLHELLRALVPAVRLLRAQ